MRMLLATTAGAGHLDPLVPYADAWRRAGHDAAIAAPVSFAASVRAVGHTHRPVADPPRAELEAVFSALPGLSTVEANARVIRDVFARLDAASALPGLDAIIEDWQPDIVLRETSEYASYIAAERHGIPHAQVCVSLAGFEDWALSLVDRPLNGLRRLTGLAADPGLAGLRQVPRLTAVPATLDDQDPVAFPDVRRFRASGGDAAAGRLPGWWGDSAGPLVYVTYGTVAATLGLFPALYRDAVEALAGLPIRVLVTTGAAGDPAALAPLPPNVHVERWWPQAEVMPHAAAMVAHGGFGTTVQGLAAGIPMVVVPLFGDQPHNARRVHETGAGLALEDGPAGIGALAGAVTRVLHDPSYRQAAQRTAAEIHALPSVADAVPLLAELARSRH